MARYAVNLGEANKNWSDETAVTGTWASTSGGSGGATKPDASTNVFVDALSCLVSTGTLTVDTAASCLSMDWTGATNTPTLAQGAFKINCYGSATFIAAMTWIAIEYLDFYGTGNLTTNTLVAPVGIEVKVGGNLTIAGNSNLKIVCVQGGTLNTNNKIVTATQWIASTANAITITLGSSVIDCTSVSYTGTNITITANTSTINVSGTGALAGGNIDYNGASFNLNGTAHAVSGAFTVANLTRNGTATNANTVTFTSGTTVTVTGSFAMIGNSRANQLLVQSSTLGTAATITAGNWTGSTNVDLMDITATNAVDFSASVTIGDAGGNSGMTFPAPVTQNFTNVAGGNFSNPANFTSRIPLVGIDNLTITTAFNSGVTLTWDMPRIGRSVDFSGMSWTGTATTVAKSQAIDIYGSLLLKVGTSLAGTFVENFRGRGSFVINNAGVRFYVPTIYAVGGTYTCTFTSAVALGALTVLNGTGIINNQTFNLAAFASLGTATRTVDLANSVMTLTNAGANPFLMAASGLTFISTGSTIILSNPTANPSLFAGGGLTYNNIQVSGAGNYALTVTGNNTFNTLIVNRSEAAKTIVTTGTTQTVNNFISVVTGATVLTMTGGTWTKKPGIRNINLDYVTAAGVTFSPVNTWFLGTHSSNTSGSGEVEAVGASLKAGILRELGII